MPNNLLGIETKTRRQLSEVLRNSGTTITVEEAAAILKLSRRKTAQLMARWVKQGWLVRVRRGLYAPIPLEARTSNIAMEDPWIVATRVFEPCYLGGWSAAEHWSLTEQIFRTVVVMTTRTNRTRKLKIQSTEFLIKKIAKSRFFGTKAVWRNREKVYFSDTTKTIVDMLDDPSIAGGARMTESILKNYLSSPDKNIDTLLEYISRMKNGAIYKRLGYLLERLGAAESPLFSKIRGRLTKGNAALDPAVECKQLITRWRLWVPANREDLKGD